jgi:hypothetical protein
LHTKGRKACRAAEAAAKNTSTVCDGDKKPAAVQKGRPTKASNPDVIDLTEWDGSEIQRREVTVLQNCVHTKITSIMNDQVAQNAQVDSLRLSLTQATDMAEKFCPIPADDNKHWQRVYKLITRLDAAEETLEELNNEGQKMSRRAFLGLDTYIESASKTQCKRVFASIDNAAGVLHGKKIKLESATTFKASPVAMMAAAADALATPSSSVETYQIFTSEDEANAFSTPVASENGYVSSPGY